MVLIIVVIIIALILLDSQIRPLIIKSSTYQGTQYANSLIASSVNSTLDEKEFPYDSLVTLSKNNEGFVSSIQTNMVAINKFQATVSQSINDSLSKIEDKKIDIPSGTLSGLDFLYGRGPNISFKLKPVGYAGTKLISKFTPAGVNQTLHQIILEVNASMTVIIPGYNSNIDVTSNYIVAETVVVGNIPQSYTYITGDTRDQVSQIMDNKNSQNTSLKP